MKTFSGLLLLVVLFCVGCAEPKPPLYHTSTFNRAQAERMMRPGRNTIIVNTFTKDPNDGTLNTCRHMPTYLFPATERAAEYIKFLYGSAEGGQITNDEAKD